MCTYRCPCPIDAGSPRTASAASATDCADKYQSPGSRHPLDVIESCPFKRQGR